jgi:hypothetical protein
MEVLSYFDEIGIRIAKIDGGDWAGRAGASDGALLDSYAGVLEMGNNVSNGGVGDEA